MQAVRGLKDVLPDESAKWQRLEAVCRDVFGRYGFGEIRTPIFEVTGLFARGIGEATDIVEKEMYTFVDRNGQSLSLRPEGTAGVIRAYIQNQLQREALTRLCYAGPMFRHERPQAGRQRQFHQIGAEVLGSASPSVDVELITLMADLFRELEVTGLTLELNSIGCPDCRPAYGEALVAFLDGVLDALCENCQRRRHGNPLRVLDCKVPACGEATRLAPVITGCLCAACADHYRAVKDGLAAAGVAYRENPRMVRGLDYYGRTAFEWTTTALGAQNTVAAGGRYDRLTEQLGGQPRPGIGFALGVERVLLLMRDVVAPAPDLFVVMLGDAAEARMLPILRAARQAGVRVDRAFDGGGLKAQLKRANKSGARWCAIVGEEELARGVCQIKDMAGHSQREVALEHMVDAVRAALSAPRTEG
ncbi:MAG: histidine--tRNA ligase [Nitrospirae bacterium]|nr:histidine--tRNA ligase [Nitrospirota bacterium]